MSDRGQGRGEWLDMFDKRVMGVNIGWLESNAGRYGDLGLDLSFAVVP